MNEICTDGRFELIAAYKQKLIERTNIETSPEEMAVIDNILFRFWQMKWLPPLPHGRLIDADALNALIDLSYPMTDRYDVHNGYAICQVLIKMLPTIIEAEGAE